MPWSPSDKMWTNQTAVVQPRLVPSQLPCGLKCLSSSSGMPIRLLWVNRIGISSTRSVVTFSCSAMQTAYRIFKMLSPFDRTMRHKGPFRQSYGTNDNAGATSISQLLYHLLHSFCLLEAMQKTDEL